MERSSLRLWFEIPVQLFGEKCQKDLPLSDTIVEKKFIKGGQSKKKEIRFKDDIQGEYNENNTYEIHVIDGP
ncbi:MAG: hypothetical protein WA705_07385 [Candidatus Ozemobacteraceae bacterium]